MNSVSFCFFGIFLSILLFTSTDVYGSDFRFPSRDILRSLLRDSNAYYNRGELVHFRKKSNFREPIRFGKRVACDSEKEQSKDIIKADDESDKNDEPQYAPVPFYRFE